MRPAVSLFALLLLTACSRESSFAPIPPQSPPVNAPDPPSVPCFFSMSEARADQAIVQGIPLGLGSGIHRWTAENAAVRCKLPTAGPWNIAMDFIVAARTIRDTGPITLTFRVNGREVAHLRCDHPGERQFRAPLPPELIPQPIRAPLPSVPSPQPNRAPLPSVPSPQPNRAPLPSVPSRDRQGAVADLVLQVSIDKPWIAPADGTKLGVLLTAMGFLQP